MALPVVVVTRPLVLTNQDNGRLPASILFDTPGRAGGPVVRLVQPATRAWRALAAAAATAGHTLKTTSLVDSYRSYEVQARVFQERYQPEPIAGRPRKWWNGEWWYQRYGTAPAAVPGTSNHGWGLAADVGEERDGDTGTESMDAATLDWLVDHELDYGFSHELQEEPWHIRYWAGDVIPAAVLAYEEDDVTPEDVQQVWANNVTDDTDQRSAGGALWVARQNAKAANDRLAGVAPIVDAVRDDILRRVKALELAVTDVSEKLDRVITVLEGAGGTVPTKVGLTDEALADVREIVDAESVAPSEIHEE